MKAVVSLQWLNQSLQDDDLIVLDCRFALQDASLGRKQYMEGHIPGAQYLDLEQDLSGAIGQHGGRHPLPDRESLTEVFSRAGIADNKKVVIYDDQGGAMASRCWWLLRYAGHEQAVILDRGFSAWLREGYPVTKAIPHIEFASFIPRWNDKMLATVADVKQAVHEGTSLLLDSREAVRYKGIEEPIDPIAGHIPTAKHAFWKDSLRPDGSWKSPAEQDERFKGLLKERDQAVIVYCGSGVTACPNVLALEAAGYTHVRLYAGSWSDWISYPEHPIERMEP